MDGPASAPQPLRIVLITGLSGAGKTLALKALEDLEHFAIDNLPSSLLDPLAHLLEQQREISRVALVMDGRDPTFFKRAPEIIASLRSRGHQVTLIFLEASRPALIRRFVETRRPHPLGRGGPLEKAIDREIRMVRPLRRLASQVIDSSSCTVHDLRRAVVAAIGQDPGNPLQLFLVSFGFKFGLPLEAAFVYDVRFLPNPFFSADLRAMNGSDRAVADFVLSAPETTPVLESIQRQLETVIPLCRQEGRSSLVAAIGCTGGHHRSVAVVEELARRLRAAGHDFTVVHRDLAPVAH